jgi:kumamolisin
MPDTGGHRGISDVSWNADPQPGNVLYMTFQGYCTGLCSGGVGGTSVAAPQWAGLAALVDQAAGQRVGELAPILYSPAVLSRQGTGVGDPYHDVTTGNNFGYNAGPEWDFPTGWGSPDAFNLVQAIQSQLAVTPTPTVVGTPASKIYLPAQFSNRSPVDGGW